VLKPFAFTAAVALVANDQVRPYSGQCVKQRVKLNVVLKPFAFTATVALVANDQVRPYSVQCVKQRVKLKARICVKPLC
jgi:hypothetical protein